MGHRNSIPKRVKKKKQKQQKDDSYTHISIMDLL